MRATQHRDWESFRKWDLSLKNNCREPIIDSKYALITAQVESTIVRQPRHELFDRIAIAVSGKMGGKESTFGRCTK
jgi:hypothetical protein